MVFQDDLEEREDSIYLVQLQRCKGDSTTRRSDPAMDHQVPASITLVA